MSERYIALNASGDDGSYIDFMAKVENGKISEVLDFNEFDGDSYNVMNKVNKGKGILGMPAKELSDKLEEYFHYVTDYAPFPKVKNISKETYEAEKAKLAEKDEKIISNALARVRGKIFVSKVNKIADKIQSKIESSEVGYRPDLLAMKQDFIEARIPEEGTEKQKATERISAAKQFMEAVKEVKKRVK